MAVPVRGRKGFGRRGLCLSPRVDCHTAATRETPGQARRRVLVSAGFRRREVRDVGAGHAYLDHEVAIVNGDLRDLCWWKSRASPFIPPLSPPGSGVPCPRRPSGLPTSFGTRLRRTAWVALFTRRSSDSLKSRAGSLRRKVVGGRSQLPTVREPSPDDRTVPWHEGRCQAPARSRTEFPVVRCPTGNGRADPSAGRPGTTRSGGLSVSPDDPLSLPYFRRPSELGGMGQGPV
jgi:hypothetical protein